MYNTPIFSHNINNILYRDMSSRYVPTYIIVADLF